MRQAVRLREVILAALAAGPLRFSQMLMLAPATSRTDLQRALRWLRQRGRVELRNGSYARRVSPGL